MLLLAIFLPPLAVYLIALGWINRRPHPILTAGAWDFAGVLFALSGFLLFGGPAFLGSLDEQSRAFWLLGVTEPAKASPNGNWTFWVVARLFYFAVVSGAAAFVLWRSRRLTSVYNVNARLVFDALEEAYRRLGLNSARYGDSFLIESSTTLQVDVFPAMRHATLRWDPADSPLRREVENELARLLAEATAPEEESILGGCLTLFGVSLLVFTCFGAGFLILLRFLTGR